MGVLHRLLFLLLAALFLAASIASFSPSCSFAAIAPWDMRHAAPTHTGRTRVGPRRACSAVAESAATYRAAWAPAAGRSTGGRGGSTASLVEEGCACGSNSGERAAALPGIAGRTMGREGLPGVRTAWSSAVQSIPTLNARRQGFLLGLRGAGKQVCETGARGP